jgi:hypothetical protein
VIDESVNRAENTATVGRVVRFPASPLERFLRDSRGGACSNVPGVLRGARHFVSDAAHWLSRRRRRLVAGLGALVALGAAAAGGYLLADTSEAEPASPAPQVVVRAEPVPEETEDLGFPTFATVNTTRVAGADAIATAAAVALAAYPSTGGVPGPAAATLVDADDWHAGIAAASLVADPIGAPILLTRDGEVPDLTEAALAALEPSGSSATDDRQGFRVGGAAEPDDLDAHDIGGANPAEVAARVERLRTELAGEPDHLLLASSDEPAFAMPAAGWAARSGDPVLFVQRDSVPAPTRRALERHEGVPVYVLGPPAAVSREAFQEVRRLAPRAQRVGAEDPVSNAIAFARYAQGSFGWNINDPGHGLVIVNANRPLDAAAASPLSASGTWGPLLLTDDSETVPPPLRGYLLDLKPGYEVDPTRAVYNHVWLIGDPEAISVAFQAHVDDLAELAPVRPGRGPGVAPPGRNRPQGADEAGQGQDR